MMYAEHLPNIPGQYPYRVMKGSEGEWWYSDTINRLTLQTEATTYVLY